MRKNHFFPARARLTPREAKSARSRSSAATTWTPSGNRLAISASSTGSLAANSSASAMRTAAAKSSSARPMASSLVPSNNSIVLAARANALLPLTIDDHPLAACHDAALDPSASATGSRRLTQIGEKA